MLALTPPAYQRLEQLVLRAVHHRGTSGALRTDVLVALVLGAPETPAGLGPLAVDLRHPKYSGHPEPVTRLSLLARERLVVRLPAPVSWRLNLLVNVAREQNPHANRTKLVVGLIWQAHTRLSRRRLHELLERANTGRADDACVAGQETAAVLSLRRPNPGPRPLRSA